MSSSVRKILACISAFIAALYHEACFWVKMLSGQNETGTETGTDPFSNMPT